MGTIATTSQKKLLSFKFDAACARGLAVKPGAGGAEYVQKATAEADKCIGICQNTITAADEEGEVALPGGGAVAKLGGTVAFGDELASTTDGSLIKVSAANKIVIAVAMQAGVSGDLIPVEVVRHKSTEAQA